MTPQDPLLIKELRRDEGVRYTPYFDTVGDETVGVGHNLKACPLPVHYPLTEEQVDNILGGDLVTVFHAMDGHLGWWRQMSYARQRVLVNMCFNLGIERLMKFVNTLAAMERCEYNDAADKMLQSKWAQQVGERATRLAAMMREG